ncbi:aldo/keto reductase [Leptolyngbya sp. AN02str]|uniref:aldo/keto reductase n=1 Tax=Leptolyngbya sp. AN02str TaxID=3423363 RepID=UPI003D3205D4
MNFPSLRLHPQGPLCSRLAVGVWRLAEWKLSANELRTWIEACLEMGLTTFDHADIYGDYTCEELFGAALKKQPGLRDRIQLISKCGIKLVSPNRPHHGIHSYDTSAEHIMISVEHSLQALNTDYLDVLLIHRPDPLMNANEVACAFTKLREAGKVLSFGVSNFLPSQVELLASRLDFPLVTNQLEISVMQLSAFVDGTLDQCQRLQMAPMAWSPLGGGGLFAGRSAQAWRLQRALATVAKELDAHSDQVAIAWLLTHPANIVPILGSGKLERLRSAVQAIDLTLTREQWFSIWMASTGEDLP